LIVDVADSNCQNALQTKVLRLFVEAAVADVFDEIIITTE